MKYRFEVLVNGQKKCVIGLDGSGVLTAIVTAVQKEDDASAKGFIDCFCRFGGLDTPDEKPNRHVLWFEKTDLKPGDEITVRILEKGPFDSPLKHWAARERKTTA